MKFSIISTFYNNTIEEISLLKNSILDQTYTNWEWIISDDFSQESTLHIDYLKDLPNQDKRIRYIEQRSKKEIFWNPQTYATGDIVLLIGGDDTILPKALQIYANHFLKYPEVILITSESNIFKPGLAFSSFLDYRDINNVFDKRNNFPLGWLNMGVPLAWRNIPIDFISDFELTGKEIINDYFIHTRLEELGRFIHLPRVFYNYKIRQNSVSRKIDDSNSFTGNDIYKFDDIITKRRNGIQVLGCLDIYNDIIEESHAFYYSGLNKEKSTKFVSFITPKELSSNKKQKIKQVWSDHDIYFNVVNDKIDYFIFYLNEKSDFNHFKSIYSQIENQKEIFIFIRNNKELYTKISEAFDNYRWFSFPDFNFIVK